MLIHILLIKDFYKHIGTFAFISPLIKYRNSLKDKGFKIKIFYNPTEDFFECDVLLVENRFLNSLDFQKKSFLKKINSLSKKTKKIFVDTTDSTGQIKKQNLIIFDNYWKGQRLKNLNLYKKPHYGGRFFTDFNNRYFKIKDSKELKSEKIEKTELLKKIQVSWNMGLTNFDLYSPIFHKLYSFLKINSFIKDPRIINSNISKSRDISCRLSIDYYRETVKLQRLKIESLLKNITNTNRLNRRQYFKELNVSKLSISPFGWGEICIRDFETFICHSCLIKPDMSLVETWPNYYIKNKSYVSFNWNMEDFNDCINNILNQNKKIKEISDYGREIYTKFNMKKESKNFFVERFAEILKK
tara:strand:+ start:190 stop:1260 length:1071 start_codon:yes stop_codon:yes gene_type:complete